MLYYSFDRRADSCGVLRRCWLAFGTDKATCSMIDLQEAASMSYRLRQSPVASGVAR